MKGQYLALEQVMIVALGLAMATSLVALLDDYRSSLFESDFEKTARVIQDRIATELIELSGKGAPDYAEVSLNLREEISNEDYRVQVNNTHIEVFTDAEDSSKKHKVDIQVQGLVDSGEINIVKNNSIRVRS